MPGVTMLRRHRRERQEGVARSRHADALGELEQGQVDVNRPGQVGPRCQLVVLGSGAAVRAGEMLWIHLAWSP